PRRRALGPDAAAAAASGLGFPVVVKRDGPAHKSRDVGVRLGLADESAVRSAAARLGGSVLVAAQVPPGLEVYCGMSRDPDVGPVLAIALGGAAAGRGSGCRPGQSASRQFGSRTRVAWSTRRRSSLPASAPEPSRRSRR